VESTLMSVGSEEPVDRAPLDAEAGSVERLDVPEGEVDVVGLDDRCLTHGRTPHGDRLRLGPGTD